MKLKVISIVIEALSKPGKILLATLYLLTWSMGMIGSFIVWAEDDPGPTVVDTLVSVDGSRLNFRNIKGGNPTMLLEAGGGMDLTDSKKTSFW